MGDFDHGTSYTYTALTTHIFHRLLHFTQMLQNPPQVELARNAVAEARVLWGYNPV